VVAETDQRLAERLLEEVIEALRSASDPLWYDPQYDVSIAEDAAGQVASDRDVNHLGAISYALSAGLPVIGWGPAQRNPGADERTARAVRQFVEAALVLIEQYQNSRLTTDQFTAALSAAYMRQATNAFTAGKRAIGNLSVLTQQDQIDIRRSLLATGLQPKSAIPVGSVGDLIGRLIMATNGRNPQQAKNAPEMEQALMQSVATRMDDVMRKGFARAVAESENAPIASILQRIAAQRAQQTPANQTKAQQQQVKKLLAAIAAMTASAQGAARRQLQTVTRMLQRGSITPVEAAARVQAIMQQAAVRATIAARRAAGARHPNQLNPDNQEDIAASMDAADASLHAKGGLLNWIVQNVLSPWNLLDPDTVRWLRALLIGGAVADYRALQQAGERAAFRTGAPGLAPALPVTPLAQTVEDVAQVQSAIGQDHVLTTSPMGQTVMVWWALGDADHCKDCIGLSDMSPYSYDALMQMGLFPGSGHTQCGGNCKCHLEYDVPTEVCADPLTAAGTGLFTIAEAMTEGPLNLVWVQEAQACATPLPIESLLGALPETTDQPIPEQHAFSWDHDVAAQITVLAPVLNLPEALRWLDRPPDLHAPYIRPPGVDGVGPLLVQKFGYEDARYSAAYQENGKALRFITGATTEGSTMFEPEMTVAALRWAAQWASERGMALEFDARLVNQGWPTS
jgi:hypothetical protein